MTKRILMTSAVALVAGVFAASSAQALTVDLLAGQSLDVGDVTVTEDGTNLTVTYMTDGTWWIKETHLFASCEDDPPTTNSGNPKVGQFPYPGAPTSDPQEVEIVIPLADIGCTLADDTVTIAAHAVVFDSESTVELDVLSDTTARVTRFRAGDGATPFEDQTTGEAAVLAWEPCAAIPNCPTDGANPPHDFPDPSLWDSNITNSAANNAGADWIWAASQIEAVDSADGTTPTGEFAVSFPVVGEVIRLEKTFDIPGPPVSGELFINCDNGFEASLNGALATDGDVVGDWQNSDLTLGEEIGSNWPTTRTADVSANLLEGENLLVVDAANAASPGSTHTGNPGGCLFLIAAEYSDTVETAWGEGDLINTRGNGNRKGNWATQFEFPFPEAE